MLNSHLPEEEAAYTVDAVTEHQSLVLSQHQVLKSPWRWNPGVGELEYVAFIIETSGSLTVTQANSYQPFSASEGERRTRRRVGSMVAVSSTNRTTLWFGGERKSCAIIWAPLRSLNELGINIATPLVFGNSLLVSMLRGMAGISLGFRRSDTVTAYEDNVVERVLTTLLVGAVLGEKDYCTNPLNSAHLEIAQVLILANFTDPNFDVEALATGMSLSRCQLQRLFAEFGTTPSETLRSLRLKRAKALLETMPHYSKQQIATRSGFKSVAALRRALEADAKRIKTSEPTGDDAKGDILGALWDISIPRNWQSG